MLVSLSIKNYALIDDLLVNFHDGFSTITGETGAGKSILLGGLSLILGKRADSSTLKDKNKKCIVEGQFLVSNFNLKPFFEETDLDFEDRTIVRREILPNGKSRAFINDTPTTLSVLSNLSDRLIDIHSQHQTLQLTDANFQFLIIDALAKNSKYLNSYKIKLDNLKKLSIELQENIKNEQLAKDQHDYNTFLLKELVEADFKKGEQEFLENTLAKLNHIEEIKLLLNETQQLAETEEIGIHDLLHKYVNLIAKLGSYSNEYEVLSERMHSVQIEFDDIAHELENSSNSIVYSHEEIEKNNNRLQLLYDLMKKHHVTGIDELIEKQDLLEDEVNLVENYASIIEQKKNEILKVKEQLNKVAKTIHNNRTKVIPSFIKQLEDLLIELKMPMASLKINLTEKEVFFLNGKDELEFLIRTNKGGGFNNLKKIASGGEMSRIMLAIKAILSNYSKLPTIIFDEIDTGVSGEVSNRIATVMLSMSKNMQVIAITHLPQIAAKGNYQYKVFKKLSNGRTATDIKLLSKTERIDELAEMLSGKKKVESAIVHAKQLLDQ